MRGNDGAISIGGTDGAANLPQSRGPDLPIIMNLAMHIFRVVLGAVQSSKAGWIRETVRSSVPFGHTSILETTTELRPYCACPVIAESFSHRPGFKCAAEVRHLIILNRMAVFMKNHFCILSVVNSAESIGDFL